MFLDYSNGSKPLWSQVASILKEMIKNNEFKVGEILPSEMKLINEFGVSRITMRQALGYLVEEGYIIRRRGKGTVVIKREDVSTSMKSSFTQLEEKGEKIKKTLLEVDVVEPSKDILELFNIDKSTNLIMMKRIIEVNGKIVGVFKSFINPNIPVTIKDDFTKSFYKLLESKGYPITKGREEITATISNEEDKKIFKLNEVTAIITRKKYGFSNDIPVELTYTRYLAEGYVITVDLN
ncbi:GntR family transcriptional regulator [Clostridium vincentii]|uniref:Putative HTH-type transcriptional regulator YurK n=1 Tax=Clostridium vincentii TaxID=52704 RepID=A0A2T0BIB6_9CLOT|nr:GntR family transcriptional regulator [Clostridium vincentii]PRR83601.1 putative HTH-type transcriptional regulator YurK [Clostridium vincentii]